MNRRLASSLGYALTALGLTAAGCSAPSDSAPSEGDAREVSDALSAPAPLISASSGLCLDVKHNVTTAGTPLQIYTCNSGANQGFAFTAAGELRVFNNTQCVQPQSGSGTAGMAAVIAACNGQANQRWTFNANGSISSQASGLCLDVSGGKTAPSTPVIIWTCNGQNNQKWSFPVNVSVVTNRYDNQRSGSNLQEARLTTAAVASGRFGLQFSRTLDGQEYAQPLYLSGLALADGSTHNVVFAATMHNTVFAYDADGGSTSPLWSKNLGPSGPTNGFGCTDTATEVGITSTPVIDSTAGTLYTVTKGVENGNWVQRLHALDVKTGQERAGSPVVISATVNGAGAGSSGGKVTFNPFTQLNRSGLLLDHGTLYLGFASHCDKAPYHGWIFAYTYANGAFTQNRVYNISPNGTQGGIWQAGVGLSSDVDGLYFAAGNGSTNPSTSALDLSESVVRLGLADFSLKDYWIPTAFSSLNAADADLSTGAILLPHDRLVTGSKDGQMYLLDRTNFGRYNASGDQVLQKLTTPGKEAGQRGHLHGGPIYYQVPGGAEWLYLWPEEGPLIGYQFDPTTHLLQTPETQSNVFVPGHPGGILALSANGTAGSGVLWGSVPQQDAWHQTEPGTLYAVDAADITRVLWSSQQNATRDAVGNFAKFTPPMIANGHVYMATFSNALRVYGMLN